MTMRSTSRGVCRSYGVAVGLAGVLLAAGSGCGRGGAGSPEEEIGVARIAIMQAPSDTRCVRITVTGSRTVVSAVDVTPGQATAFTLGGLPLGNDAFNGEAFGVACAMLTPSAVAAWIGDAVVASVVVDPPVAVTLVLRRNGRATVGVDFQDDPDGGATGIGGARGTGGATGVGGATGGDAGVGGAGAPGPITFAAPMTAPIPAPVGPMVSTDFNRDGNGDLAFATSSGAVFLVLSSSGGIIGPVQQIAQLPTAPRAIVAGDFDGNGSIDLAIALSGNPPVLLSGIGPGVFGVPTTLSTPPLAVLAAGDVDGDGVIDIVGATDTGLGFAISQRTGTRQIFSSPNGSVTAIAVANIDGDPLLDVALLSNVGTSIATSFLQRGIGVFVNGPSTPLPFPATALAAADFDGDGLGDLAVGGNGGIFLLSGTGAGGFVPRVLLGSSPVTALVAADFNGDGRPDLASTNAAQVLVSRNLGAGMFDGPVTFSGGLPPLAGMVAATLTTGARPSLVVGSATPTITLLRNTSP